MQRAVERFFQLSLLGLVAAGFLAVAGSGFLDTPTVVLVSIGLALRGVAVAGLVKFELSDLIVNLVTLGYIAFFAADYFLISRGLLEATVHLVCFLAVMKILTARSDRDYVYTASIALIELVAAAMLSVNLNFFAYLAVYLVCAIAASTSAEIRRGLRKPGRPAWSGKQRVAPRLAGITALITAGILLLTAALFIVLPRSANAAMRRLVTSRYHLSGFSNEVALGDIGAIQRDSRPVMHVRPYSQSMPSDLKWRGLALTHFDGRKWTDPTTAVREVLPRKPLVEVADRLQRSRQDGSRVWYRVNLNPTDSDALFVAGTPEFVNLSSGRVIRSGADGLRFSALPSEGFWYEVSSFLPHPGHAASVANLTFAEGQRDLQLPAIDPRIEQLARSLKTAPRIESYLRTQFGYTLDLPEKQAADPLADFLFDRRKGHCEYFSSAMTVMLRSLGTPARVVNGFQSGTFNPVSGLYIIRASDAHSWVEAWLPESGWTTFDPTPYGARASTNGWMARLNFYVDAAQTFWQEWVLDYDLNRQITLAERLQETTQRVGAGWDPSFRFWRKEWGPWLIWHAAWLLLPLGLLALRPALRNAVRLYRIRRGRASQADVSALYRRMLRILKSRGYEKPAWFTAAEFSRSLPPSPLASAVEDFTDRYQAFRYGNDLSGLAELGLLLDRLRTL